MGVIVYCGDSCSNAAKGTRCLCRVPIAAMKSIARSPEAYAPAVLHRPLVTLGHIEFGRCNPCGMRIMSPEKQSAGARFRRSETCHGSRLEHSSATTHGPL